MMQETDGAPVAPRPSRRRKKKRSRAVRILKYTSITMGVVVVAGVGGGYFYIQNLNHNIRTGSLHDDPAVTVAPPKPNAAGQTPLNILVIGSDGRDTAADCKLGGACDDGGVARADVEMLVHLSADRSNASVTSIPRDTVVDLANCDGHNNRHAAINGSLNYGGPGCVVDTWTKLTGIHIDHYMMIHFSGVVSMADAIKGVPVCAKENVSDNEITYVNGVKSNIGSHLVFAKGTRDVTGVQALQWLRTRHAFGDGTDIGRTEAQHLYLNSMVRKMKSLGTLTNIGEMNALATAATKALQVDHGLGSVQALTGLALQFNKVDPSRITTVTIPWHYGTNPTNPANLPVELTQPAANQIFAQIRNDVPLDKNALPGATPTPTPSPTPTASAAEKAAVHISVRNASGVDGRGQVLTDFLKSKGFTQALRDTTDVPPTPTGLTYPTADKAQAQAVAATLGLSAGALTPSASATRLTLVIGTDWTKGDDFASTVPKKAGLPAGTDAQNGADATQCMDVNPAPYTKFRPGQTGYLYSWTGSTPPKSP
ncbi:LCP family protein [Streptacidiphilus cavernicola]|uniref:LCP family protein n=1 Tax=Streptacidiphilus cavernicola TaxID=3342716 RepID=A0ABV6VTN4_9ACTN